MSRLLFRATIIDDDEEKKRKRSDSSNFRSSSEKSDKADVTVKSDEPFEPDEPSKSDGSGELHKSDDPEDDLNELNAASDEKKLFQKVDELLSWNSGNLDRALTLLELNELKYSENVDFLWRLAQAYWMKHEQEFNSTTVKDYVTLGK